MELSNETALDVRRGELVPIESPSTGLAMTDVVLGGALACWSLTNRSLSTVGRTAAPVAALVIDPPFIPRALRVRALLERSAATWQEHGPEVIASAVTVRDRVVPTVTAAVLDSLDLTELVIDRVNLRRVVQAALAQLDLTDIVVNQVDLDRVADRVLDHLDLDAIARQRMDLLGLANYIIDGIDLPEIIRESTGSVASETVRTVRMQSIDADQAVQRIVDRVLLRRKADRDSG